MAVVAESLVAGCIPVVAGIPVAGCIPVVAESPVEVVAESPTVDRTSEEAVLLRSVGGCLVARVQVRGGTAGEHVEPVSRRQDKSLLAAGVEHCNEDNSLLCSFKQK